MSSPKRPSQGPTKRGEVNELRALLRDPKMRSPDKFKSVVEKVIAYMTLGIDVSPLFSDMVMATQTRDLVQKKMVYLYLCTYASQNSELALLAISSLQKDCQDTDPMVRGLALRSLCSLRVSKLVEYLMSPIRNGLTDASPYVRKTACTGVAKLYSLDPESMRSSDLIEQLYNRLQDGSPEVISNALAALMEILYKMEGRMPVNKKIMFHLLNKLGDLHEWGQCQVLELLAGYEPDSEEEMYDIMNLLEERLRHSNSAVVLATVKVFLRLTADNPDLQVQVMERVCSPLITLIASPYMECSYVVLNHVVLLMKRPESRGVFDEHFHHFYVRYDDPVAVKSLKLDALGIIANVSNGREILEEIAEYITNVDVSIARKAIRTIGTICLQVEECAEVALEYLLSFLDLSIEYVNAEACVVLKDVLRRYPDMHMEVLTVLVRNRSLQSLEESSGKVAAIWMLGEYGDVIQQAPYILETMMDSFSTEDSRVRMEMLTACMKLFFKRPPEVQAMLGTLLASVLQDADDMDLRDRARVYYKLLHYDVHEAARVVNTPKGGLDAFTDMDTHELQQRLFDEFNTLSVVLNMPSEKFVGLPDDEEESEEESVQHEDPQEQNLLDAEYGGEGSEGDEEVDDVNGVVLFTSPEIDAAQFQEMWVELGEVGVLELLLQPMSESDAVSTLEGTFGQVHFSNIAYGSAEGVLRMYFFAQGAEEEDQYFLIEALFDLGSMTFSATFKGTQEEPTKCIAQAIAQAVSPLSTD